MNPIDPDDPDTIAMNEQYRRAYADLNGSPPAAEPATLNPTTHTTTPQRVRCETCGGRGTFHARGGAATGTCPLPPEGCGGFGQVDPTTHAAIPRDRRPDSLAAMYARQNALEAAGAAKLAAAGKPSPTCCVKGCAAIVDHEGDICQPHVDEIDRRLATLAEEAGIPVERVYAKLNAYCDEQAKRRARA